MADVTPKVRRRRWGLKDMETAMEAVEKGTTVSEASRQFNVPRKTLDDRVKGRVQHGSNPGPNTALTAEEEKALVAYLFHMAERGFPLAVNMAQAFAWAVSFRSGSNSRFNEDTGPGKHWWRNFRARHPELTLRTSDNLDRSRASSLTKEVVDEYFTLLKSTLEENGLMNSPRQLFNCDETYLPLNIACEKVISRNNAKYVYAQARGTSEHITLLCCASAAGIALPPMIIFSRCFPGGSYRFDGPDDALYAKSDSGWIDSELFLSWMNKAFLKHCGSQRPVLLFVDGHASHITLDVIDVAKENDVILFCLPPHTTHALQPLDVSVFKSLKSNFSKTIHALSFTKKDFVVSKRDFARVVKTPFERAFSISNIKSGFSKCGIYPFNPDAIDHSKIVQPSSSDESNSISSNSSISSASFSQDESISSVNPSPIVSSLSSTNSNDSYCSPQTTAAPSRPTPVIPATPEANIPVTVDYTPVTTSVDQTPVAPNAQSTPVSSFRSPVENPLVRAGLVPAHLADIFATDYADATTEKRGSRRITGVRVLTSNDYVERMKEKERKEREAAEQKQKRKEEREMKKIEREKECERKKKQREKDGGKRGKGKKPQRQSSSDEASASDAETHQPSSSRTRSVRPPSRYCDEETADSDESDTVCIICGCREPPIKGSMVFWVDCDSCGEWAHTHCALGCNSVTRNFVCLSCTQK